MIRTVVFEDEPMGWPAPRNTARQSTETTTDSIVRNPICQKTLFLRRYEAGRPEYIRQAVRTAAAQVAKVVWKAARGGRVHWSPTFTGSMIDALSRLFPPLQRAALKSISGIQA